MRQETFGMDPLFSEFGIYHPDGQLYKPVDHKVLMKYKESAKGQILEEGINEEPLSSFIAVTSYATQGSPTIPFYIFYSMFGFQRVADLIWSAADSRARFPCWRYIGKNHTKWRRITTPRWALFANGSFKSGR